MYEIKENSIELCAIQDCQDDIEEPISEDLDFLVISLEETIGTSPHSREVIKEHLQKAAEWQKQKDKQLVGATQKISHQHGYDEGRSDMKEEMKEHINNIISYLEEFLQPGFPIFKAGISKEITWLNSLIAKNH